MTSTPVESCHRLASVRPGRGGVAQGTRRGSPGAGGRISRSAVSRTGQLRPEARPETRLLVPAGDERRRRRLRRLGVLRRRQRLRRLGRERLRLLLGRRLVRLLGLHGRELHHGFPERVFLLDGGRGRGGARRAQTAHSAG